MVSRTRFCGEGGRGAWQAEFQLKTQHFTTFFSFDFSFNCKMTLVVLIVLAGVCCGCMAQSYPELPAVTSECEVAFGKVCKDLSFPTCQRKKGAVTIAKRPHVARKQIGNESCKNKLIFVPIYSCTQTTGKPLYELMCNDGSKAFQIPAVVLSSNCRCKFTCIYI